MEEANQGNACLARDRFGQEKCFHRTILTDAGAEKASLAVLHERPTAAGKCCCADFSDTPRLVNYLPPRPPLGILETADRTEKATQTLKTWLHVVAR